MEMLGGLGEQCGFLHLEYISSSSVYSVLGMTYTYSSRNMCIEMKWVPFFCLHLFLSIPTTTCPPLLLGVQYYQQSNKILHHVLLFVRHVTDVFKPQPLWQIRGKNSSDTKHALSRYPSKPTVKKVKLNNIRSKHSRWMTCKVSLSFCYILFRCALKVSRIGSYESVTTHLPVIDLSSPTDSTSNDLLHAAREFGFLYVRFKALPIDAEDVDSLFDLVCVSCYTMNTTNILVPNILCSTSSWEGEIQNRSGGSRLVCSLWWGSWRSSWEWAGMLLMPLYIKITKSPGRF